MMKKLFYLFLILFTLSGTSFAQKPFWATVTDSLTKYEKTDQYDKLYILVHQTEDTIKYFEDSVKLEFHRILGSEYYNMGLYSESYNHYFKFLELSKKANNKEKYAVAICKMGQVQEAQGDFDKALNYLTAHFNDIKKSSPTTKARYYVYLSRMYLMKEKYDTALINCERAYKYIDTNNIEIYDQYRMQTARVYIAMGKFDKAIPLLDAYITAEHKLNDKNSEAIAWFHYGELYYKKSDYDKSIESLQKAFGLATEAKSSVMAEQAAFYLSDLYKRKKDFEKAIEWQFAYSKSMKNRLKKEKENNIAQLSVKFNLFENERQKEKLENENIQKQLELDLSQSKVWTWRIVLIAAVLIGGLFFMIYFNQQKRKKLMKELEFKELEDRMIRTQMNPHFISNMLAVTQKYVLSDNKIMASDHIGEVGELMRLILENSRKKTIPLSNEISLIEKYIAIQKHVAAERLNFKLHLSEEIKEDIDDFSIPPMLIQPVIENSLKYAQPDSGKKLTIDLSIKSENNYIIIQISDDGIGFSDKGQSQQSTKYTLASLKEREEIYSKMGYYFSSNVSSSTTGTTVLFKISR